MNDKDFLSYFDCLINEDEAEAVKNADNIVTVLRTVEYKSDTLAKSDGLDLGEQISEDLRYSVDRLFKGSTSENFTTKKNLSATLLTVLRSFEEIETVKFLSFVEKTSDRKNAATKGQRSHFMIARLMGIYILIQSKRIDELPNSFDVYSKIYSDMLMNIKEMNWVSQLVYLIIRASIEASANPKVSIKKIGLVSKIFSSQFKSLASNFDLDYFIIQSFIAIKQVEFTNVKNEQFGELFSLHFLDQSHLNRIIDNLVTIYPEKNIVFQLINGCIYLYFNDEDKNTFWDLLSTIIEKAHAQHASNHKLVYTSIMILKYFIKNPLFTSNNLKHILKQPIFESYIRNLRSLNKHLQQTSKKIEKVLSTKILSILDENAGLDKITFLKEIKTARRYPFDSKNQLAITLLDSLDPQQAIEYVNFIISQFKAEKESYQFYLSELLTLIQINQNIGDETIIKIMKFYLEIYKNFEFTGEIQDNEDFTKQEMSVAITKGVRDEALTKFNSTVSLLIKRKVPHFEVKDVLSQSWQQKKRNSLWQGISKNGQLWVHRIANLLLLENKGEKEYEILQKTIQALDTLTSPIKNILKGNKEMQIIEKERVKKSIALIQLIGALAIQLLVMPDAADTLNETILCAEKVIIEMNSSVNENISKKQKLNNKKSKTQLEEPNPVDVLIDIMISLMTRCSSFLREAIKRTFSQFIKEVTDLSLASLVAVITRKDEEYLNEMNDEENNLEEDNIDEESVEAEDEDQVILSNSKMYI